MANNANNPTRTVGITLVRAPFKENKFGSIDTRESQYVEPARNLRAVARSNVPHDRVVAMDQRDHVMLLQDGVLGDGQTWADLGSGEGAFTLALADLLGPTGSIHTVDRDSRALQVQLRALRDLSLIHI